MTCTQRLSQCIIFLISLSLSDKVAHTKFIVAFCVAICQASLTSTSSFHSLCRLVRTVLHPSRLSLPVFLSHLVNALHPNEEEEGRAEKNDKLFFSFFLPPPPPHPPLLWGHFFLPILFLFWALGKSTEKSRKWSEPERVLKKKIKLYLLARKKTK